MASKIIPSIERGCTGKANLGSSYEKQQGAYAKLKYRLEYLTDTPDECYVDMRLGDLRLIFEHLNDKS